MPHTDPISDMISRLNNAMAAGHGTTSIPASKIKHKILEIMVREGYLNGFRTMKDNGKAFYNVDLKYKPSGTPIIKEFKRLSKPGLRIYSPYKEIPRVKSGYGTTILSTSKGIMTDKEARKAKIGGELICSIF